MEIYMENTKKQQNQIKTGKKNTKKKKKINK